MDDSMLVVGGIVVGVALLILGSRIRSRSALPRKPQKGDPSEPRDPSE
jgi:hypothetical protein